MGIDGTIGWTIARAMRLHADKEAVVDGATRMTYAQWGRLVHGLGGGLRSRLGLGAGDIVAVLSTNTHRHLTCAIGIPASGLVVNDLNFRLAVPELEFILNDSGARAIVVDETYLVAARELARLCPALDHVVYASDGPAPEGTVHFDELTAAEPLPPDHPDLVALSGAELAAISYTGGTTGLPKGVMQSHANLLSNAKHMHGAAPYRPSDRYLHAAPMFHAADSCNTYALTWIGGTHVIVPGFDAEQFGETMQRERITLALIVPTMINMLVNHPATAQRDFSAWRQLCYGASPMPIELLRRACELLPCTIIQLYGMTEASPLLTATMPEDNRRGAADEQPYASRLSSCGVPVMGVEVEVRRADGTMCEAGEAGEIFARGPNIMMGYWNRPEETAKVLVDGWYKSGDVAYADNDGYLFIVDRAKDMIISGGENIYTTEVENAIFRHPGVLEVAVFGIPNEQWGEAVHAEVVPKPGSEIAAEDIMGVARQHIAGFKVPRSVNVRTDALPKSGAGKILKRDLRAPFWEGKDRAVN